MKINIMLVLLVFFSIAVFAGSKSSQSVQPNSNIDSLKKNISGLTADSIDIREIVLAQIEAARKKQSQDSLNILDAKNIPLNAVVIPQAVIKIKPKVEKTKWDKLYAYIENVIQNVHIYNEVTIKLSIMGTAAFFAFLLVFVRRKRLNTKKNAKTNIKDGIKLIREERVKDRKNSSLSLVRNKLIGSTSSFQLSYDSVVKNARELNIAKGEIYLAARIKSHELKKASS
ncbi:MAG: hypothetical protein WCA84_20300 [Ignavibacteriaceae bacterium]